MKVDDIVTTISRDYPNGRFIHDIGEKGSLVRANVKAYFKSKIDTYLFIAREHMRSLNKAIGSKYTMSDIDEIKDCEVVKEWEKEEQK